MHSSIKASCWCVVNVRRIWDVMTPHFTQRVKNIRSHTVTSNLSFLFTGWLANVLFIPLLDLALASVPVSI